MNRLVIRHTAMPSLFVISLRVFLVLSSVVVSTSLAAGEPPATGRWHELDFSGPDDGQPWHSLVYLTAIDQPQLITRHKGLLIRCTKAPVPNNLQVTLAFGSVLRANFRGDVKVNLALDGKSKDTLSLVTRNHANAEFVESGAKSLMASLLGANTVQFSARLSPKGEAKVSLPLGPGRAKLQALLSRCGIDLDADVRAERRAFAARQPQRSATAKRKDDRTPLQRAVSAYLAANNNQELELAGAAVVQLNPEIGQVIEALTSRNALSADAQAGLPASGRQGVSENFIDGLRLPFHVARPLGPQPAQGMPMALVLHGGVQRSAWQGRERWWQSYPFSALLKDFLVVSPAAWREAHWWGDVQSKNLKQLIAKMQRHYNVDASRVFVIGVSDGAAGALHQGMTNATALAGVVSLIGHPQVLFDSSINSFTAPPIANLGEVPVFMINGGADERMPIDEIKPWQSSLRSLGVSLNAHVVPRMAHELEFNAKANESLSRFLKHTRRVSGEKNLSWEAGPAQLPSRHRWLVIDALQPGFDEGCVRAEANKDGSYALETSGVARMRVLQGHSEVVPRQLQINGERVALEAAPSVATLLKWFGQDGDASRFIQAEHRLEIATNTSSVCRSSKGHALVAAATQRQEDRRQLQAPSEAKGFSAYGLDNEEEASRGDVSRPSGDPTKIKDRRNSGQGSLGLPQ